MYQFEFNVCNGCSDNFISWWCTLKYDALEITYGVHVDGYLPNSRKISRVQHSVQRTQTLQSTTRSGLGIISNTIFDLMFPNLTNVLVRNHDHFIH